LFDNFGQYFLQHYFAALDEKRLLLSDIVQDLPVVIDKGVRKGGVGVKNPPSA